MEAFTGGQETTSEIAEGFWFSSLGFPFSIATWISMSTSTPRLAGIPLFATPIFSICEFSSFSSPNWVSLILV